jgi:hypothetical protein
VAAAVKIDAGNPRTPVTVAILALVGTGATGPCPSGPGFPVRSAA